MSMSPARPLIVIHGGAGTMGRDGAAAAQQAEYRAALLGVLGPAQDLLAKGGSALDAVSLAVDLLEDCPLFNAGHGAVFTHDETHELDAAIMDGATLKAGAVGCVARIKRPLRALAADGAVLDHDGAALQLRGPSPPLDEQCKFGTVGAVALDAHGNLAAGTSTGDMYRGYARVGEAPQTAIFR